MVPQRGLILSPAADQIPHRLVQRIQSGDFVEMRDLLADNVALHRQLEDLHSSTPPGCHSTAIPPPPPQGDSLKIREELRHGGNGW